MQRDAVTLKEISQWLLQGKNKGPNKRWNTLQEVAAFW